MPRVGLTDSSKVMAMNLLTTASAHTHWSIWVKSGATNTNTVRCTWRTWSYTIPPWWFSWHLRSNFCRYFIFSDPWNFSIYIYMSWLNCRYGFAGIRIVAAQHRLRKCRWCIAVIVHFIPYVEIRTNRSWLGCVRPWYGARKNSPGFRSYQQAGGDSKDQWAWSTCQAEKVDTRRGTTHRTEIDFQNGYDEMFLLLTNPRGRRSFFLNERCNWDRMREIFDALLVHNFTQFFEDLVASVEHRL